jgi:hypothetical protein
MKTSIVQLCTCAVALSLCGAVYGSAAGRCSDYTAGDLNLYWGDLHVHTALSLDAYAYGTTATPADAYAFARGGELTLGDKTTKIRLQRPLDFTAVTDHAETFDVMYLCTDPTFSKAPYCTDIRAKSGTETSGSSYVFRSYLLPLIAGETPKISPLCSQDGIDCDAASQLQWQRTQSYANEANSPCEFTAFIANEWSATPNNQHWHRNLIYSGTSVSRDAIDYLRYPSPEKMWAQLEKQCDPKTGCDVIAIPHNTNYSQGGGFDVETSDENSLRLRGKYERLIEIHQSKGNSECLAENWDDYDSDCGFETSFLNKNSEARARKDPAYLKQLNRSYTRNILSRGLLAYQRSGPDKLNPLQLGIIGSTDGHVASPGAVSEANWKGDAWGGGDLYEERRLQRLNFNPGGLVAVWSQENTRESLFQSLKRRETYATSGTRIKLRLTADLSPDSDPCGSDYDFGQATAMGGVINSPVPSAPRFSVIAAKDVLPLSQIEIIKGSIKDGETVETVFTVERSSAGFPQACKTWSDPDFDPLQPAYWYTRVQEVPSPRWSKILCEKMSNCAQNPEADRMIQEQAWSSPIWYLP